MSYIHDKTKEIITRYPEQKPTVFNYKQAREDILWLVKELKDRAYYDED